MSEQHEMDVRSESPGSSLAVATAPKKHFETVESSFFDQGEQPDFAEWQGILDEKEKWYHLSYRSLVGVSIVSTALAFTSCLLLFRANAPTVTVAVITKGNTESRTIRPEEPRSARSQPQGPATPTTAALPSLGEVPAAPAPPSTAVAVAEAPKNIAPVTIPATVETPRPTVVVAAEPTTTTASPTKAIAAIFPAPSTATSVATTERGGHATAPVLEAEEAKARKAAPQLATASNHQDETHQHCRQSIRSRHAKDILATCAADFEADTTDAEAAVAVARVEFDRGRFAEAYAWSKKAITANPDLADAYVFAGGAEQNQGHGKAAKESYMHYLRLAPSGIYAAELRSIVKTL
jgi:hypothetical protein